MYQDKKRCIIVWIVQENLIPEVSNGYIIQQNACLYGMEKYWKFTNEMKPTVSLFSEEIAFTGSSVFNLITHESKDLAELEA